MPRQSFARWALSWLIAGAVITLRMTCRTRMHNDPRPQLRSHAVPYAFSVLHAHQIAAVINREPGTAAMVSQSPDGQLLMTAFWALGVKAMRGSSNSSHSAKVCKGGQSALRALANHLGNGSPAYLAVDGPHGPRSRVSKGIAVLAKQTGAAVLNVVAVPRRRWIIRGVWDRFQVPKPFTRIDGYFGDPLYYQQGEGVEAFRQRIETQLQGMESRYDAMEAHTAAKATTRRSQQRSKSAVTEGSQNGNP